MDRMSVLLLANGAAMATLNYILGDPNVDEVDKLYFLFSRPETEERAFEVMEVDDFSHLDRGVFLPPLPKHYRDLEWSGSSKRSSILRSNRKSGRI